MDKQLFIKCIGQLKAHQEKSDRICNLLDSLGDEAVCFYPFVDDDALIFEVLKDAYSDDIVGNDVSYFCYELEFGEKWAPGCMTENGEDVEMRTIDDLYAVCEKGISK